MITENNICVSIGSATFSQCLTIIESATFVEIRIDLLDLRDEEFITLFKKAKRSIATCRTGQLNDKQRIEKYMLAINAGANFIDLDMVDDEQIEAQLLSVASQKKVKFITSYHDHLQTPDKVQLQNIIKTGLQKNADIIKIACFAKFESDVRNLLNLYTGNKNIIAFAMGNNGQYSRVIAPLIGASFTYAAPEQLKLTAPGQHSFTELTEMYKFLGLYTNHV